MSEGLEALKELRYRITNFNGKFNDYNKIMGTIEQGLKALEIIKEKQVNFYWLSLSSCVRDYNVDVKEYFYHSNFEEFLLTEEEYDLLKEVLL